MNVEKNMRAGYLKELLKKIPIVCRILNRLELNGQVTLAHPYVSPITQFVNGLHDNQGADYVLQAEDFAALINLFIDYARLHHNTSFCLLNNRVHIVNKTMVQLAKALTANGCTTRQNAVLATLNRWRAHHEREAITYLSYFHLINPQLINEVSLINANSLHSLSLSEVIFSDNGNYVWSIEDLQITISYSGRLINPYSSYDFFSDTELQRMLSSSAELEAICRQVIQYRIYPSFIGISEHAIQQLLALAENALQADDAEDIENRQQAFNEGYLSLSTSLSTRERTAIEHLSISQADSQNRLLDYRNNAGSCFSEMVRNLKSTLKNYQKAVTLMDYITQTNSLNLINPPHQELRLSPRIP